MRTTFTKGVLYGLVFLTSWLLIEGAWVAGKLAGAPVWGVPFNVGVAAPVVLLASLLGGLVCVAWAALGDGADPIDAAVSWSKRRLVEGGPAQRARRSAWMVAVPVLVAAWFGLGLVAGERVLSTVKTTAFAVLLVAGIQLVLAVGLAVGSALLVAPLAWLFGALGRRLGGAPWAPLYTLAAMLVAGVLGLVGAWVAFPDVLPHLPWNFALGPALGLLALAGVERYVGGAPARSRMLAVGLIGLVMALGLSTLYLPQSLGKARQVFVDQTTISGGLYRVLHERLDYDEDGALHLYGQNDCEPHDASIGPNRGEIIANGIDENCSGADLEVDLADFDTGESAHPRPGSVSQRPHIVLVTTDGLSHQHTTVGGYRRDTTPNLAAWAERATVFENAFSLSSSTRLSMPGIVTGKFNSMVKMKNRRIHPYHYARSVPTMASVLKDKGYRTVHIPGDDYFLKKRWGGYTGGFDVVDASVYKNAKSKKHTAPDVTDAALEHIARHKDGDQPLFLWLHYYDHHEPNQNPKGYAPYGDKRAVDRYDNELHFTDSHWGRLIEAVEQTWRPEDYVLVFTSDHGEAFDKRHPKGRRHDFTLDTKVLHVPLMIQGPEQRGKRIGGLASHADILPTVANIVGQKPDEEWIGESLVPALFEGNAPEKDAVFSLFYIPEAVKRGEDGFWKIGVRTEEYAYWEDLRKGTRKLIDWRADPEEQHDLSEELPELFETYRYVAAQKLEWLRERERALERFAKKKKKD